MTPPPNKSSDGQQTTRDVTIQGIRAEAAVVVAEKAVDLRMDPKSFSATFTAAIRTILPTSILRKKEHSNEWKKIKKPN